jgi:hypothetical protein
MIFFSLNPGVISRKVGCFEKDRVLRGNGYLFQILGEYSKRVRFIQKRNSSRQNDLYPKSLGVCSHPQDDIITKVNKKRGAFLKKANFREQWSDSEPRVFLDRNQEGSIHHRRSDKIPY